MKAISIIVLLLSVLLSTGCASKSNQRLSAEAPHPAMLKLIEVTKSIAEYDKKLSAVESARFYEATGKTIGDHDISLLPGLEQVVSLGATWNGPLDKLLIKLSELAGLNKPRFINRKPPGGVIVSLNTDYRRVIDMVLDAESQSSQVNISLKMRERLFEIEYVFYR